MTPGSDWILWALLSAVFAGATAVLAKLGIEGVDADLATLVRTLVIVLVLSVFVYATGKWRNPLTLPSRTLFYLALSALATGASWVCYFRALQLGPASLVAPVEKFSIVLVVMFAFIFLGERPVAAEWLGLAMVVAGVLTIAVANS